MTSVLLALSVWSAGAATVPVRTWFWNNAGVRALSRGEKLNAYQDFVRALDGDPLNLAVQVNLALTFEHNEEYDKAVSVYESLLAAPGLDGPTKRLLYFNLGNVLGRLRRIPAALRAYQAALEFEPGSEKIKTNVELLFQKGGGQGDGDSNSDDKDQQNDPKKNDQNKKGKDKDDKKDKRDNDQKREDSLKQPPEKNDQKGKDKPKPFESQELRPEDVKRILDEIKNQEQSIRAQEYDKQPKDGARGGKDW